MTEPAPELKNYDSPPAPTADAGLPMSPKWDPEKLAAEVQELNDLKEAPLPKKIGGYVRRTGPGLLQSAMTLGAGSATASVLAGASFGYKLLWVQPIAVFLGVMMFAALSNIVLTTGERPYKSFGRELGKFIVLLWALGTIFASVIWHFPQYTLLAGAGRDLAELASLPVANNGDIPAWVQACNDYLAPTGIKINDKINNLGYIISFGVGLLILAMNVFVVFNYGKGAKGVKLYERFLRLMIAAVIFFFLLVVILNFQKIEWLEVWRGFTGYYGLPKNAAGQVETSTYLQVLGMLGASVGINMTFLYPYSLLAKGWGKEHRTLAKWDLAMTMFIPFIIVTSLIILTMAVTGVYTGIDQVREGLTPLKAAESFDGIPGGKIIFCLGLIGMCGGAISAHMVVCGFTFCEMFGLKMTKNRFRLFALVPAIGFLGVVIPLPLWFPVIASAICAILLPISYLIFFILNNKRSFIGDAVGKGFWRWVHNFFLLIAVLITSGCAILSCYKLYNKFFIEQPAAPPAATKVVAPAEAPKIPLMDTKPAAAKPADAKPADAKPAAAKPADAKPADAKPADAKPADAKPADAKPADAKPADAKPAAAKPADAKPADAKPAAAKPADAKPAAAKPADAKPADAKPAAAKPADAKPADAKPADAKPADVKPADAKPAAAKPAAKPAD